MVRQLFYSLFLISFIACQNSEEGITPNPEPTPEIQKGKITQKMNVNGQSRDYIVYIPKSYSGNEKYPLLFAFHGLGGNMEASYNNSKFHELAETENFIVVHPNGVSSKWNAVTIKNNIDVEFTEALIEKLQNEYAIDPKRIYSSGMSNGGYFSFLLACELSDKVAAIGSVTGLMFKNILDNCTPTRPVPVMQIHGTQDNVVDYSGVDGIISFWINHNKVSSTPTVSKIPDTNTTDGSTIERFIYKGDNVEIQHLKVTGGGHDWPGHKGNMDISASKEVWNFIKQYDINGKIK